MNLVILENGSGIGEILQNILPDLNIKLTTLHKIDKVVEFQENHKLDLLLVDFDKFSNKELSYKKIRSNLVSDNLPIIFISSTSKDLDQLLSYDFYLDDFLLKPLNPVLLKAKIRSYLMKLSTIVEEYEEKIEKLKESIKYFFPHEFRTSLTNILGFTNIISQMSNSKNELNSDEIVEIHDISNLVISSGNYLKRISENLILFSHLELIKFENKSDSEFLNSSLDNTNEIIDDVVFALTAENKRKDDLEMNLTPTKLDINEYLFYKVIYELIDNAFKFSPVGTKIIVNTSIIENQFYLEVQDYGHGMLKKELNHIGAFRQFERHLYEQQGIGLGLTLTKKITELYDGTFDIKSKKSEGTIIQLSIPLKNRGLSMK